VAIVGGRSVDDHARFAGQELFEDAVSLATQLLAIAEEEDPLNPTRAHQHVTQRDGNASLARAGGLHDERLAEVAFESLSDALHRFELIYAVRNGEVRLNVGEELLTVPLMDEVLKTVL